MCVDCETVYFTGVKVSCKNNRTTFPSGHISLLCQALEFPACQHDQWTVRSIKFNNMHLSERKGCFCQKKKSSTSKIRHSYSGLQKRDSPFIWGIFLTWNLWWHKAHEQKKKKDTGRDQCKLAHHTYNTRSPIAINCYLIAHSCNACSQSNCRKCWLLIIF